MYALLRLVNLAVIAIALVAIGRSTGEDDAYAAGRWIGAALLSLAPLLSFLALRRRASSQLSRWGNFTRSMAACISSSRLHTPTRTWL